jgi:hypothetical protein
VQALFDYLAEGLSLDYFLETFEGVTREQAQAAVGCSDTRRFFQETGIAAGTRRKTSKGQATSEEESRFPRFFDTLEYREGNPERGFFLKCLRGGRTSCGVPKPGRPGGGSRQRRSHRTQPRTERRAKAVTVEAEAMEGERPREEKSQESQDGVPQEKSGGAAPTGNGRKPLKRGRDGLRSAVR